MRTLALALLALGCAALFATPGHAAACTGVISSIAGESRCLEPGERFQACPVCPEMVVIPAGRFTMGSPATEQGRAFVEGPVHEVTIARPFALGRFEVTFDGWDACVAEGACRKARDPGWGRGRHPVVNVSWIDITTQYLPWLSVKSGQACRLPSEAEWEYAARAGTTTPFSTGPTISTGDANYDGSQAPYGSGAKGVFRQRTLEIGQFAPNAFGLHDMHGNVAEWVADCYADSYVSAPVDGASRPGGDACSRILRGGSWIDAPRAVRSAYRGHVFANSRFIYRGFRVACDL